MTSADLVVSVIMVAVVLGTWVILEELAKGKEEDIDDNDINGSV